jgi:hypothetical protein
VQNPAYIPHVDLLLQALRINRERLSSKSKIAIDAKLLKMLLQTLAAGAPFSEQFYLATYSDVAEAHNAGQIQDLHRHFIETGFFEGRFGAAPTVDETYYTTMYKDVAVAIGRGDVVSGADHYMRSGASEGRLPSARMKTEIEAWLGVLRDEATRTA